MDRKKIREIKRISKKGDTAIVDFELDYSPLNCNTKDDSKISLKSEKDLPKRVSPELNFHIESSVFSTNDNALVETNFNYENEINIKNRNNQNEKISIKKTNTKYSLPKRKV
jgi:hypothetical protein